MNDTKEKPCNSCIHRINIPGNCHIGCNNVTAKPERPNKWPGSGIWPVNFDEATVKTCDGWSNKPEDKIEREVNPIEEMMRLFL